MRCREGPRGALFCSWVCLDGLSNRRIVVCFLSGSEPPLGGSVSSRHAAPGYDASSRVAPQQAAEKGRVCPAANASGLVHASRSGVATIRGFLGGARRGDRQPAVAGSRPGIEQVGRGSGAAQRPACGMAARTGPLFAATTRRYSAASSSRGRPPMLPSGAACPPDMVEVEGDYRPIGARCLRWLDPATKLQCAEFERSADPGRCPMKMEHQRFCVDGTSGRTRPALADPTWRAG
jgi:hypothetical protein